MGKFEYRKLGGKNLKIFSNPYKIQDQDTGEVTTYLNKTEFDAALNVYETSFTCEIDDSEFNNQINS